MQILASNVAKSLRNLETLRDHIHATMDSQRAYIVALIEPPQAKLYPSVDIVLRNFFKDEVNTEIIRSPLIRSKSKIIFIHNKQTEVNAISIVSDVANYESGRCFGVEFTSGGVNYHLHAIHGLDLINYPETDFERNVCEYNIYKQIRSGASKNPTIVVGDFNARMNSAALNSELGLNASIDGTKKYAFLNVSDRLASECQKKFANSNDVRGSFYFHGNRYSESKWAPLDQLLISNMIQPAILAEAHYISMLQGGTDLVKELKTAKTKENKTLLFDHLPIYISL